MRIATGGPHVSLYFYFSLIEHIRVDEREQRRTDQRDKEVPERQHSTEEGTDECQCPGNHEQYRSEAMRFIPDVITGERPRSADADEEVSFCFAKHIPDEKEQNSHGRQQGFAHLKVCLTQIPAHGQNVQVEQIGRASCRERV